MPKYQVVAARKWDYGDQKFEPGDVVGEIDTDLAPVVLLDAERGGKLQVQSPPEAKEGDSQEGSSQDQK